MPATGTTHLCHGHRCGPWRGQNQHQSDQISISAPCGRRDEHAADRDAVSIRAISVDGQQRDRGGANPGDFIITANSCPEQCDPAGQQLRNQSGLCAGALDPVPRRCDRGQLDQLAVLVSLTGTWGDETCRRFRSVPPACSLATRVVGTIQHRSTGDGHQYGSRVAVDHERGVSGGNFGDFVLTNVTCLGVPIAPAGLRHRGGIRPRDQRSGGHPLLGSSAMRVRESSTCPSADRESLPSSFQREQVWISGRTR